jgi:hypothetical protein
VGPRRSATDVHLHDRGAREGRPWSLGGCGCAAMELDAGEEARGRDCGGTNDGGGRGPRWGCIELTAARTLGAHVGTDRRRREGGGRR